MGLIFGEVNRRPWVYVTVVVGVCMVSLISAIAAFLLLNNMTVTPGGVTRFFYMPITQAVVVGGFFALIWSGLFGVLFYWSYIAEYRKNKQPDRGLRRDVVFITILYASIGIGVMSLYAFRLDRAYQLTQNKFDSIFIRLHNTLFVGSPIHDIIWVFVIGGGFGLAVGGVCGIILIVIYRKKKRDVNKNLKNTASDHIPGRGHTCRLINEAHSALESKQFETAEKKAELAQAIWDVEEDPVTRLDEMGSLIDTFLNQGETPDSNAGRYDIDLDSELISETPHERTREGLTRLSDEIEKLYEGWMKVDLEDRDREEILDQLENHREKISREVPELESDFETAIEKDKIRRVIESAERVIDRLNKTPAQEIDIEKAKQDCHTAQQLLQDGLKKAEEEGYDNLREEGQMCLDKIETEVDGLDELKIIKEFENVKDEMEDAERKYQQGEYYEAREDFGNVSDQFEKVLSRATKQGMSEKKGKIRNHLIATKSNREKAQQALYGDGEPPELAEPGEEVETMDASEFGGQALETPPRRKVGNELQDELPEHEVLEHIGSGGNADVHKIRLKETGEVAALKVPQWEGTLSVDVVEDFTDEAETWDKLDDHSNIVEVLNWGSVPYPWMILEYMDGSLRDSTEGASTDQKLGILTDVADALEYAHGHGVIHLDIKPENVLMSNGTPKIADWGLSQVLLTHTQTQMGLSAPYAAPEQLTDDMGEIDRQTDVYQLGVLSYELLTGRLPFDTEKMADLQRQILEETPEPPSRVNDELPKEVDEVILKAMAKSKEERYDAVVLFRNAVQNID